MSQPRLRKVPHVKQARTFEQQTFTGDPFEVLSHILNLRQTGTVHIHISQGSAGSIMWEFGHRRATDGDGCPPAADESR